MLWMSDLKIINGGMKEDIKEVKKEVKEDWLNAFPELSAFAQNKFYKLTSCIFMGIEAVNIPAIEGYKPHFVIYPLWKESVKQCLDFPLLYICIKDRKGFEFSIPYLKHTTLIDEAIECLKKQIPFSLNGDITLNCLLGLIDNYSNNIWVKSNTLLQVKLLELKFYATLYFGIQSQVQNILDQIRQVSTGWNMQIFENLFGKFDDWFLDLQKMIFHRDEFLKRIERNRQDKKIANLWTSRLIL